MITRARVAGKFLFFGLLIGIVFAPRSGRETRKRVQSRTVSILSEVLDIDLRR